MATRAQFRAQLTVDGQVIGESIGYAWNSTVRKSEALARDYARSQGVMLKGGSPEVEGEKFERISYKREWTAPGIEALASVVRV